MRVSVPEVARPRGREGHGRRLAPAGTVTPKLHAPHASPAGAARSVVVMNRPAALGDRRWLGPQAQPERRIGRPTPDSAAKLAAGIGAASSGGCFVKAAPRRAKDAGRTVARDPDRRDEAGHWHSPRVRRFQPATGRGAHERLALGVVVRGLPLPAQADGCLRLAMPVSRAAACRPPSATTRGSAAPP